MRSHSTDDYAAPHTSWALDLFLSGTDDEGQPRDRWRPFITPPPPAPPARVDPRDPRSIVDLGGCLHPECEARAAYRPPDLDPYAVNSPGAGSDRWRKLVATVRTDHGLFCSTRCRDRFRDVRKVAMAAYRGWTLSTDGLALAAFQEQEGLRLALRVARDEAEYEPERIAPEPARAPEPEPAPL